MKHACNQQYSSPPGCFSYQNLCSKDLPGFDIKEQKPKALSPFTRHAPRGTKLAKLNLKRHGYFFACPIPSHYTVYVKPNLLIFYLGCHVFSCVTRMGPSPSLISYCPIVGFFLANFVYIRRRWCLYIPLASIYTLFRFAIPSLALLS